MVILPYTFSTTEPPVFTTSPLPKAVAESPSSVPPPTAVPPEYVLLPWSFRVPVPSFVSLPVPEMSFRQRSDALKPPLPASIVTVTSLPNAP
ncbi:hypothetical protein D3C71_1792130 [compost metagenome]